ncbi:hypothetical protein IT408_02380 [Candidatus Uhrbacteria bacterium]|nr:hypothetical protein [Candidatus Uhrbacteria bacterium]
MQSRYFFLPLVISSLLLGVGCQPREQNTNTTQPQSNTQQPNIPIQTQPVEANAGNCDNPYFPLRPGTKMSYKTHAAGRNSSFTWESRELTADNVSLLYTFDGGLLLHSDFSCTSDGLIAQSYLDMNSAMTGSVIKTKTTSSTGTYLPKDLAIGKTWESAYEVETENENPEAARLGMKVSHMTLTIQNKVLSEESVTVPAGTFTALKVESKNVMKLKLSPTMPPIDNTFTSFSYYVRGKGLVKSTTEGKNGVNSDLEATEIIVP